MIAQSFFGRTGHLSARVIFGAYAVAYSRQSDADRTLDLLLRYGVNHIDTAFSYGESGARVGPWMKRYRNQFFLATKTGERTYQRAKEGIHRSLDRLQTDHVDLDKFTIWLNPMTGRSRWGRAAHWKTQRSRHASRVWSASLA